MTQANIVTWANTITQVNAITQASTITKAKGSTKINYGIIWKFFPNGRLPMPPFENRLFKKLKVYFAY